MSIIKEMNTNIQRSKLEESAAAGDTMAQAELDALDIGLTEGCAEDEEGGFTKQQMADMKKLADQTKTYGSDDDGEVKMFHQEIGDKLGDDLEMLEYSPEEIEQMVPKILKMMDL